jgi:phage tail tube protein FII
MAKRGRKKTLTDRVTSCVSLEREHNDYVYENGIDKSKLLRECIAALMKNSSAPREKIIKEIQEKEDAMKKLEVELVQLRKQLKEMDDKEEQEKLKRQKNIELLQKRENLFNTNYKRLVGQMEICELDFYRKVRIDFGFENLDQAKEWLFEKYSEIRDGDKRPTETKIKRFLRYEQDMSNYW